MARTTAKSITPTTAATPSPSSVRRSGTPRTGSIEPYTRVDGTRYYRARIWLADGTRERVDVPDKYAYSEERRSLYAAALQEREDETGELLARKQERIAAKQREANPDPAKGETLLAYRKRLNLHRAELGKNTGEPSAWSRWIGPHIGDLEATKLTRADVERFRDMLDAEVTKYKRTDGAEGVSAKRALNVWSEVTTTCKAMVSAKRADLRVRTDNPCTGVLPPEKGDSKKKTFVYPSELAAVLACEAVPLEWREVYAIAAYLYLRPGELQVLTFADVDLEAGVVHVTKAWDERAQAIKSPKTSNGIRDVPIPAELMPLLERMAKEKEPRDLVVPVVRTVGEDYRAEKFRGHLRAAGVTRPRLFENTSTTMAVNYRSLRDSGITFLALAGVGAAQMLRRAGHDHLDTTMGYVKMAEDIGGSIGEPFGPLPASLSGQAKGQVKKAPQKHRQNRATGGSRTRMPFGAGT